MILIPDADKGLCSPLTPIYIFDLHQPPSPSLTNPFLFFLKIHTHIHKSSRGKLSFLNLPGKTRLDTARTPADTHFTRENP